MGGLLGLMVFIFLFRVVFGKKGNVLRGIEFVRVGRSLGFRL